MPLDLRVHAVRGDLADVRLAEFVFAPHYAQPIVCHVAVETVLRSARAVDSDRIADLAVGSVFEVLEIAGSTAWGVAADVQRVGYLDASALGAE